VIIPVIGNPAAQALALMIQKGGTLRLRRAELEPMQHFALSVEPSPKNPEVLHFKVVTQEDVRAMMLAQIATAKAAVEAATEKEDTGPKD
jgi:hypothetical protein